MWKCPKCGRSFRNENQHHFCGKPPETIDDYILTQDERRVNMNDNQMIPFDKNKFPFDRNGFHLSPAEMQAVMSQAKKMMEVMMDYTDLRMVYGCALKIVRTKFEVLDSEFEVRNQRNPINFISSRVKSNQSIIGKMIRRGIPLTIENMEKQIQDIAGIRIICSYEDDIYHLADALLQQDNVTLLKRKDYIANPKPNGYRSLHLIVSVPVYFADQKRDVPVEVQIRTIAMDFWASLEHSMKYKQEIKDQDTMAERLKSCADRIAELDEEMQAIRKQIEAGKDVPTEEEMLIQRLGRMDSLFNS